MKRSKAGAKEKKRPEDQNYPNQNTIKNNIICLHFMDLKKGQWNSIDKI